MKFKAKSGDSMLVREQIRAARALLGWSARELAERSGLHITTVLRMEKGAGPIAGNVSSIRWIQEALESEGAYFIDDAKEPGVRLRTRRDAQTALRSHNH